MNTYFSNNKRHQERTATRKVEKKNRKSFCGIIYYVNGFNVWIEGKTRIFHLKCAREKLSCRLVSLSPPVEKLRIHLPLLILLTFQAIPNYFVVEIKAERKIVSKDLKE